jgi:hypothetical protein
MPIGVLIGLRFVPFSSERMVWHVVDRSGVREMRRRDSLWRDLGLLDVLST